MQLTQQQNQLAIDQFVASFSEEPILPFALYQLGDETCADSIGKDTGVLHTVGIRPITEPDLLTLAVGATYESFAVKNN